MKYVLFIVAVAVSTFAYSQSAHAHVLITDTTHSVGAVLHIIPDDDPVAGEDATIFFDLQDKAIKATNNSIRLAVESSDENSVLLPMKRDGSLATANYTFPTQGLYMITITVTSPSNVYVFTYSQRVSRGVVRTVLDTPQYPWAEATLVGCGVLFMIGGIFVWNRRDAIKRSGSF